MRIKIEKPEYTTWVQMTEKIAESLSKKYPKIDFNAFEYVPTIIETNGELEFRYGDKKAKYDKKRIQNQIEL